jgi:hypothetical protein
MSTRSETRCAQQAQQRASDNWTSIMSFFQVIQKVSLPLTPVSSSIVRNTLRCITICNRTTLKLIKYLIVKARQPVVLKGYLRKDYPTLGACGELTEIMEGNLT